ncbi:MAG: FAD-dependent oxidoreductase [Hyphomicrobiaceae bacterium]|nr:FAD-dependent oxidoreductase [Hyphomicrobiaceae bacterium]
MTSLDITVAGAGILGLWQAFELARRGHKVTLREATDEPTVGAASRYAGAMLAPCCEAESAEPVIRELGRHGVDMWRQAYPGIVCRGTLVVAASRDRGELTRFARMAAGHRDVAADELARLEPELAGRFARGLLYEEECHLAPRSAILFLVGELRRMGAILRFGEPVHDPVWMAAPAGGVVIDCRGLAARSELPQLRGVRGEMAVLRAPEVALSRPIRLLHPRQPLYVVPWGDDRYMVGATLIEREDGAPVTVRSALELLGLAYALHPGFAEAAIEELGAGVRPAFPDNIPRAIVRGRRILVNGAYRHGFLFAPVLATAVAEYLERGTVSSEIMTIE